MKKKHRKAFAKLPARVKRAAFAKMQKKHDLWPKLKSGKRDRMVHEWRKARKAAKKKRR